MQWLPRNVYNNHLILCIMFYNEIGISFFPHQKLTGSIFLPHFTGNKIEFLRLSDLAKTTKVSQYVTESGLKTSLILFCTYHRVFVTIICWYCHFFLMIYKTHERWYWNSKFYMNMKYLKREEKAMIHHLYDSELHGR